MALQNKNLIEQTKLTNDINSDQTKSLTNASERNEMEKTAVELKTTSEEIFSAQRKMESNSEEIKQHKDKLSSVKNQMNKWILTHPTAMKKLSVSTLQEHLKESPASSQKNKTSKNVKDKTEKKHTQEDPSLQGLMALQNKNLIEQIKLANDINSDQTKSLTNASERNEMEKQLNQLKAQEDGIKVQIKDTIKNVKEKSQEMKRIITEIELQCQRPDTEIKDKEMGTVVGKSTKLIRETPQHLLMESTNVFRQRTMQMTCNEMQDEETSANIEKLSDWMSLNTEKQKQSKNTIDPEALTRETDACIDVKEPRSTELIRFKAEIIKIQEIIKMIKLEFGYQEEKYSIHKDQNNADGETAGLLQNMKEFQELLKTFKTAMMHNKIHLKENSSTWKIAMNKRRRELDYRLDKTLRERDELEILKVKLQQQLEDMQQKLKNVSKCRGNLEKIAVKAKDKQEKTENNIGDTEVKLQLIKDLKKKIDASKQHLENIHLLRSHAKAKFEIFKNDIRQKKKKHSASEGAKTNVKKYDKIKTKTEKEKSKKKKIKFEITENEILTIIPYEDKLKNIKKLSMEDFEKTKSDEQEKLARSGNMKEKTKRKVTEVPTLDTEAAGEDVRESNQRTIKDEDQTNQLRETIERQQQELTGTLQLTKNQIHELELLKSEVQVRKKESEHILRKIKREKTENEKMLTEIKQATKSLKREAKKKGRDLDIKLETIRKEKDELEMLILKQKQLNEKQVEDIIDEETLERIYTDMNKNLQLGKGAEKEHKDRGEEVHIGLDEKESLTKFMNARLKMMVNVERVRKEFVQIMEKERTILKKHKEELEILIAENKKIKKGMSSMKMILKRDINKMLKQGEQNMKKTIQGEEILKKGKHEYVVSQQEVEERTEGKKDEQETNVETSEDLFPIERKSIRHVKDQKLRFEKMTKNINKNRNKLQHQEEKSEKLDTELQQKLVALDNQNE
ncbi:synaptonemal complex protein 1, partial [Nematolebias whitei]|uniref:synaptonemal complex protein 1 n=1 Tax=Nematolebias whitei TaxID=451745 RepID=UPI0018981316